MRSGRDPVAALRGRLAALPTQLRTETEEALRGIGATAVAEARRLLARSNGPEPSAPGEPPRDLAGHLAASLAASVDDAGSITVTADSPAPFLEYGTRHMAPRPFLRPAAAAVEPAARDALRAALARAARQDEGSW